MGASKYLHKISVILKVAIALFLCVVLISNLYLIAAQMANRNSLPKILGFAEVIVISGSMHPAIEAGDLIIIKELEKYKKDDIVTYHKDGVLITHRIVEVNQSGVVTRGDSNNVNDDPVSISDVEGKVVLCVPGIGKVLLILKKPTGILAASCLVLVLYMVSRVVQGRKQYKK